MSKNHTEKGEVIAIDEPQTFPSGFTKQEFVIKTEDDKYPQDLKFELLKERVDQLIGIKKGDTITVHFQLRGREYNQKYYNNAVAWKLDKEGGTRQEQPAPVTPHKLSQDSDDDIPF